MRVSAGFRRPGPGARAAAIVFLLSLFLLRPAGLPAQEGDGCFLLGPWVSAADENSALLVWVCADGCPEGAVTLEPAAGGPARRLEVESSIPRFQRRGADDLDYTRQLARLEGLAPSTAYRYRASCGPEGSVRAGSFRTAPAPGAREPFRFAVLSDTHGGHDAIAAALAAGEPDFVVHTGDFSGGRGHDWGGWLSYFRSARPYLESSVIRPVVGGHDVRPARNFRALFGFSDPAGDPRAEDGAATYYSFTFGNLLYIVLDYTAELEEQLAWVEEKLAASTADWVFVSLHDSMFTAGSRGSMMRGVYRDFARLFEQHGVDIVIYGHDHIYERSLPIGAPGASPVHYVTTNAGGNFRVTRPSPVVAGGIGRRALCYALFEVDGRRLVMEVKDIDGAVIDRLELVKDEDGRYQLEIMARALDMDLALEIAHVYVHGAPNLYNRRDLAAEFLAFPRAGEKVAVALDTGAFPAGARLHIFPPDGDEWQVTPRVALLGEEPVTVTVTAPEGIVYAKEGFNPPLRLGLNLELDGRLFEPVGVTPTPGPDTLALLDPDRLAEKVGLEQVDFSDDLVPAAALAPPGAPAFGGAFRSRGPQKYYTWVEDAPARITLTVTGGGISQERYRRRGDFDLELHRPPAADGEAGPPVSAAPVRRDGRAGEITLEAPAPGLYLVRFNDGRDITTLEGPPGLPLTLKVARDDHPAYPTEFQSLPDLVFYVPSGTGTVTGHAWARRGSMRDGAGAAVFDFERFEGFFDVPVPDGSCGAFWQLRGLEGRLYFLNVPPYLARGPAELLLPREVVEKDGHDD